MLIRPQRSKTGPTNSPRNSPGWALGFPDSKEADLSPYSWCSQYKKKSYLLSHSQWPWGFPNSDKTHPLKKNGFLITKCTIRNAFRGPSETAPLVRTAPRQPKTAPTLPKTGSRWPNAGRRQTRNGPRHAQRYPKNTNRHVFLLRFLVFKPFKTISHIFKSQAAQDSSQLRAASNRQPMVLIPSSIPL